MSDLREMMTALCVIFGAYYLLVAYARMQQREHGQAVAYACSSALLFLVPAR